MEKKKIMIVGNRDDIAKKLAEVGMEDEVEIVDTEKVTAFDRPPYYLTIPDPELYDMRGMLDNSGDGLTKKERQSNAVHYEDIRRDPKIQRNEPCPCGSGLKYKKCCGKV